MIYDDIHGPIPSNVETAIMTQVKESGQSTKYETLRHLYMVGHMEYSPHMDWLILTWKGKEYHVDLLMGRA